MSIQLVWLKNSSQTTELTFELLKLPTERCLTCESSEELYNLCGIWTPDLVILDMNLEPRKSWLLIFDILQIQLARRPYIVVLADVPVTEDQFAQFQRRKTLCYEFGADIVSVKPIVESTLKGWLTLGNITQDRWS